MSIASLAGRLQRLLLLPRSISAGEEVIDLTEETPQTISEELKQKISALKKSINKLKTNIKKELEEENEESVVQALGATREGKLNQIGPKWKLNSCWMDSAVNLIMNTVPAQVLANHIEERRATFEERFSRAIEKFADNEESEESLSDREKKLADYQMALRGLLKELVVSRWFIQVIGVYFEKPTETPLHEKLQIILESLWKNLLKYNVSKAMCQADYYGDFGSPRDMVEAVLGITVSEGDLGMKALQNILGGGAGQIVCMRASADPSMESSDVISIKQAPQDTLVRYLVVSPDFQSWEAKEAYTFEDMTSLLNKYSFQTEKGQSLSVREVLLLGFIFLKRMHFEAIARPGVGGFEKLDGKNRSEWKGEQIEASRVSTVVLRINFKMDTPSESMDTPSESEDSVASTVTEASGGQLEFARILEEVVNHKKRKTPPESPNLD